MDEDKAARIAFHLQALEELYSQPASSAKIQRGAQGSVCGPVAYDGQEAALKIYEYTGLPAAERIIKDFEREYQSLKALLHPSIVRFIAFQHFPERKIAHLYMAWASTELSNSTELSKPPELSKLLEVSESAAFTEPARGNGSAGPLDLQAVISHHHGLTSPLSERFIWHVLFHLSAALSRCHHGIDIKRKHILKTTNSQKVLDRLSKDPPAHLRQLAEANPTIKWTTEEVSFSVKDSYEPIIHRDVKPRNVLLSDPPWKVHDEHWRTRMSLEDDGKFSIYPVVLLGDFGFSAPLKVARTRGIGTYGFIAPEVPLVRPLSGQLVVTFSPLELLCGI